MKKRGALTIYKYIYQLFDKGYSQEIIKSKLLSHGYDEKFINKIFVNIKRRRLITYSAAGLFAIFAIIFLLKPSFTGLVIADDSYPGVIFTSADYSRDFGLLYQGLGSDNKEHIYKDKNELSIQGKQKGSINIIDYDNQGKASYFTTGFYNDALGNEIAGSDLYDALGNKINTGIRDAKYSASVWCDMYNDGFAELIIIGTDNKGNKIFEIYKNEDGTISKAYSFDGIDQGDVECFDMDGDGWRDVVVCGLDINEKEITKAYRNDFGTLKEYQSLAPVYACDIETNDFNKRGKFDFIISGENENREQITYLYDSDSLKATQILKEQQLLNPSMSSADYNFDGTIDLVITGNKFAEPKTLFYKNINGEFTLDNITSISSLKDGKALFLNDNGLMLFITGRDKDWILHAHKLSDFSQITRPSAPIGFSYKKIDDTYIQLTWQEPNIRPMYYIIRAGDEISPNKYISGINLNLETTSFKILKTPCLNNIDSFFFQVKAIDGAYAESEWSDKFYINCITNNTANQTINTTLPLTGSLSISSTPKAAAYLNQEYQGNTPVTINELLPGEYELRIEKEDYKTFSTNVIIEAGKAEQVKAILEPNETFPLIWSYNDTFASGNINYSATYQKSFSYVSVSERITNIANVTMKDVKVWHDKRWGIVYLGPYDKTEDGRIEYDIGIIKPNATIELNFLISKNVEYNKILMTQVDAIPDIDEKAVITIVNLSDKIKIEDNKTIIKFDVRANETSLSETGVKVRMEIPKCLIEKINEMAIKSGRLKVKQKFKIEKEDPIISFDFAQIISPEELKLEIAAVAEANCTDQIRTEIIAKEVSALNDEPDNFYAFIQFILPFILILSIYFLTNKFKKKFSKLGYAVLMVISTLMLIYEIADTINILHPALDFFKKYWSSVSMVIFVIVLNPAYFLFREDITKWARMAVFNCVLAIGYIFLNIKNIIYYTNSLYLNGGQFQDFSVLMLKNAPWLELNLFSIGIGCIALADIIALLFFKIEDMSFAESIGKKKYIEDTNLEKTKYVIIGTLVFFVIFTFLFDWFSVGVDAPFIVLLFILSFHGFKQHLGKEIREANDNPEGAYISFMNLFKHWRNKKIGFSAFCVIIFIVEAYNYLPYFLFGMKNTYFEGLEGIFPTIWDIKLWNSSVLMLALNIFIYLVQFLGLISMMYLAFKLWHHFFIRRERDKTEAAAYESSSTWHVVAFFFAIFSFASFCIRPVFNMSWVSNERVSGVFITLNNVLSTKGIWIDIAIFSALAMAFAYFFVIKKKLMAEIAPYLLTVFTTGAFCYFFATSYIAMVTAQIARITYSEATILHFANIVFLAAVGITCLAIILYSLKCFISEFLGLFYEVFGHLEWYRAIAHFFCRHIEHVPEEKIKQIEVHAKKLLEEGNSVFVIESLSNTFGVKERTLRILLKEILKEYEINNVPLKTDHHVNEDSIKPLRQHCERIYYGGIALSVIIQQCRDAGYSQDEIAIAMWRIKPRSEDRNLFKEMRAEL